MGGNCAPAWARRRFTQNRTTGRASALIRALVPVVAAITLMTGAVTAAGPASAAASGWHVQHTPNPPSREGALAAVSCASSTACMAAGSHNNGGGFFVPLAEMWNGTSWSVRKPPAPANAETASLLGISCASATACVAVGSYRTSAGVNSTVNTLAEVWNGTSWSIQPTPNPASNQVSVLTSVSCSSANACAAVGYSGDFGGFDSVLTLAEAWNGTSWSIQPTPNPTSPNHAYLTSVSCTSPSACIAVGTAGGFEPVAEAWNGTSWSLQKPPAPAGATGGILSGVSCTSASACTAVGNYQNGLGTHILLAETWNGTAWSIQPTPVPAGASRSYLNGVFCLSASRCTAVGNYQSGTGAHVTLAEAWNGTSWSIQATPNPPALRSGLSAVTCLSAGLCTAVGGQTSRYQVQTPLALAWNGTSWSLQRTPAPHTATQNVLIGVACPAATDCFSVGAAGSDAGSGTLTEHWDGAAWSIERTPVTRGTQDNLTGIACTSAAACTAVGGIFTSRGGRTLAERWNGTSWSLQRTPSEPAPQDSSLHAVSCASPSSCVAVGIAGSTTAVPLAETWNGTSWSIRATVADGPGDSGLLGVSCASASDCLAVGFGDNTTVGKVALAERWDGTQWSGLPVPAPAGAVRSELDGVSCTSASACTAAGTWQNSSGNESTLAEVWDGTSWSIQPTPNRGNGTAALLGVSCTAPSACTAVGFYDTISGTSPLAEAWNGTSWSIQGVPSPPGSTLTDLDGVACSSAGVCTAVGAGGQPVNNMGLASFQTLAEAEP